MLLLIYFNDLFYPADENGKIDLLSSNETVFSRINEQIVIPYVQENQMNVKELNFISRKRFGRKYNVMIVLDSSVNFPTLHSMSL